MVRKLAVTIHDVGRAANVSVSTVSRVLNNKDDVAPDTYEKVQCVIEELGYTSSLATRRMRSRKTNVIDLIMPDVQHSFCIQVIKGVDRALTESDYDLIVYTSGTTGINTWPDRERSYVSLRNGSITDGMILVVPTVSSFSTTFSLVAIDPHKEGTNFPAIISTNQAGHSRW